MVSGAGISLIALYSRDLNFTQAGAIFVVGSVAGLLPDLDSDSGKPLIFLSNLVSVLVPAMLFFEAARLSSFSPEFLICYFTASYLFVYYVICSMIRKITVHRGMMHSLPFAVVCGEIGYLLFVFSGRDVALVAGLAVFAGCVVHLFLDELSTFSLKLGIIPVVKRSSGSAFKLISASIGATLFTYLILLLAATAIFLVSRSFSNP